VHKGGDIIPTTKASQKAVAKYMKSNYDELKIRVPKGKKEEIQSHAAAADQSVNAYVSQAVDERMEHDEKGVNNAYTLTGQDTQEGNHEEDAD
jgi:hypothetical protein